MPSFGVPLVARESTRTLCRAHSPHISNPRAPRTCPHVSRSTRSRPPRDRGTVGGRGCRGASKCTTTPVFEGAWQAHGRPRRLAALLGTRARGSTRTLCRAHTGNPLVSMTASRDQNDACTGRLWRHRGAILTPLGQIFVFPSLPPRGGCSHPRPFRPTTAPATNKFSLPGGGPFNRLSSNHSSSSFFNRGTAPFSFAVPAIVQDFLNEAGWASITVQRPSP